ncbi:hypothetical protein PanWU01x14_372240, partial [Parasponia andersonii]
KSHYTSFRNQNLGKEEAEEFALLYSKLTEVEKANYADIVHDTEIRHAESGELQGESEADNDKARELKLRCSFDHLSRIGNVLTEDQKEAVRQVGFWTFLRQNYPIVDTSLILWLVDNIDPSRYCLTLHGNKHALSRSSFEMVIGIKDGGESIEFQGVSDISDLKNTIIGDKCRISLSDLEELLQESQDVDDLFLARFALLAIGTILCPSTGIYLSNLDLNVVKHAKNLSRCTIYLQLLYLHHVELQTGYVDRSIRPIDLGDFEQCSRILKWIRSIGGFSSSEARILLKLIAPKNENQLACPKKKIKKKIDGPMTSPKKDKQDELAMLKDEVATLRSMVVCFPDHIHQLIEMELKKTNKGIMEGSLAQSGRPGQGGKPAEEGSQAEEGNQAQECNEGYERNPMFEAIIIDLTTFCNKKTLHAGKADMTIGKKNESTWYEKFMNSDGTIVGPFTLTDGDVGLQMFKMVLFVVSSTIAWRYEIALYGKVSIPRKYMECMLPGGQVLAVL